MPKRGKSIDKERFFELHKEGLTDKEIAVHFGISQSAVNYRRTKYGLPSNYKRETFQDDEIIRLNKEGLTDKEIAKIIGVSQSAINYRRQRLGLESNFQKRVFNDEKFLVFYHEGLTDREISEKLDVTPAAVNYRRDKLGLISNSKEIDEDTFLSLYRARYPIELIVDSMHVSTAKVLEKTNELHDELKDYATQEGL